MVDKGNDSDNVTTFSAAEKSKNKLFHASLRHDGRGVRFLKVLFRARGSIIPRTVPVAIFSASISVFLMLAERFTFVPKIMLPFLKHPIAVQMLAIVLGYVTVLRTNIAVDRYFEGMTNVQFFGSKWSDAYTQLCAFIRSSAKLHQMKGAGENTIDNLAKLQIQLLHWFSMLHALAINELQVTQCEVECVEDVFMERMEIVGPNEIPHLDFDKPLAYALGSTTDNDRRSTVGGPAGIKTCNFATHKRPELMPGLSPLVVIGQPSDEERSLLIQSESKIDLVHSWIIEAVSCASLQGFLLTQPPILSRVYQELSNGMLGFNQGYKIALVQFPFAFAQMLTLFLVAFLFACPIAVYVFTGGEFLTPALTLFTVLGFWGIHEIAVEIENPFGMSVNHLPLIELHETMTETLVEVTIAKCPVLPK